jgi:hypothetical protein
MALFSLGPPDWLMWSTRIPEWLEWCHTLFGKLQFTPLSQGLKDRWVITWLAFFFFNTGVWTQGFGLAKQELYCLRYASKPLFAMIILEIRSQFLPIRSGPQSFYFKLSTITGITIMCHLIQLFSTEIRSSKLFWQGWPETVIFLTTVSLHSLGWQTQATVPSYWLIWGLLNSTPRLALNRDLPDLRLPSN